MFGSALRDDSIVGCANNSCTKRRFPARDLLFVCPGGVTCEGSQSVEEHFEGQRSSYPDRFLFRPRKFAYSVRCPRSDHNAILKVCPHCGRQQPISMGDATTIAVIGSSASGKTCFITSLIHQIDDQLAYQASYGMALEWRDDDGRDYFRDIKKQLFDQLKLPALTQKKAPLKSLDVNVSFTIRGWLRRLRFGGKDWVPVVFPDPSGELTQTLRDPYSLTFLCQSPQVMLIVDPLSSRALKKTRQDSGLGDFDADVDDPRSSLEFLVKAVRVQMGLGNTIIPKDLAVVLTKSDEPGVFDPDDNDYDLHRQSRDYDPRLTRAISQYVERHMEDDLKMQGVVALAKESFRRVSFFSASALGRPPIKERIGDQVFARLTQPPAPRRVEEPFLWFLHRRGLL